MNSVENKIQYFLQSVCRFVTTEGHAQDIQDELKDHIDSHIASYESEGYTLEEATDKALQQMGDPKALSYHYKDTLPKGRIGVACFLGFLLLFWTCTNFYSIFILKEDPILDLIFTFVILASYCPYVLLLFRVHKKAKELNQIEPLFIIQTYKESSLDKWLLGGVKGFILLIIILFIAAFWADNATLTGVEFFLALVEMLNSLVLLIILYMLFSFLSISTATAVYEEGLLTFTGFTTWDEIKAYRLNSEHHDGKVYYHLQLKIKQTLFRSIYCSTSYFPGNIKVTNAQRNLIQSIMEDHQIVYSRYM